LINHKARITQALHVRCTSGRGVNFSLSTTPFYFM